MKEKILKLAKRLNKFTLDEIASIAEAEENEVKFILDTLEEVKKSDNIYIYISSRPKRTLISALQPKLDYHSRETIDMIIKCFCAGIDIDKAGMILEPQKSCISGFYKMFREALYLSQEAKLRKYINQTPKAPRQRSFFDKTFYFYIFDGQLYFSIKKISTKTDKPHSQEEIKLLKILYSRLKRQMDKHTYKKYAHHHIAEQIWRDDKTYEELNRELHQILNF